MKELPKEAVANILADYDRWLSDLQETGILTNISKKHKISMHVLVHLLKRNKRSPPNDISLRHRKEEIKRKRAIDALKLKTPNWPEVVYLYVYKKLTMADISAQLGICIRDISLILSAENIRVDKSRRNSQPLDSPDSPCQD